MALRRLHVCAGFIFFRGGRLVIPSRDSEWLSGPVLRDFYNANC